LHRRFYNSARKWWPHANTIIWSLDTVRTVLEKCDYKSVISRESNADLLNIVPKLPLDYVPHSEDDLVVVTKREAQRIKTMTAEKRALCFRHL
jgi:hypothetical protein